MTSFFTYTTTLLQRGVREHQLLSTEQAVHLLTDVPARLYGLHERGRLRAGAPADVVVFDEDRIASEPIHTRFDLPGGAGRLYAAANGIGHVLVNGTEIVRDGELSEQRPGRVLRSGRDTVNPAMT
jgi:N-acyl-D-aspartate/D-glutamate deacylase